MTKIPTRLVLLGAMIAALMVASPMSSASASGGAPAFCQSGNVCAFELSNLQGCQMNFATPDTNFANNNYHKGLSGCENRPVNDSISSIWNDSSYTVCFYLNKDYNSFGEKIGPKKVVNYVKYNEAYSSWKRC